MDAPEIRSWSPDSETANADTLDHVLIKFSEDMDANRTEKAFSLEENGDLLEGRFSWEGKTLSFTPYTGFSPNRSYVVTLDKSAEDEYGNSMDSDWNRSFQTGEDLTAPRFISAAPGHYAATGNLRQAVSFEFSEALDQQSVRDSFSVEPDMEYHLEWDQDGSIFTFLPLEDYEYGKEYIYRLSTEIRDKAGNVLENEYVHILCCEDLEDLELQWFSLSGDSTALLKDTLNDALEKDSVFTGRFNRCLSHEERSSIISITPAEDFSLSWDDDYDEFELTFDNPLEYVACYDLSVNKELYILRISGPDSIPLAVQSVFFCPDAAAPVFTSLSLNSSLGAGDSTEALLDILLSHAELASLDQMSFLDAFSVTSSVLTISPWLFEIYNGSQTPAPAVLPGAGETLIRLRMSITDSGLPGTVRFSLDEEFIDSLNNSLSEKWTLMVNQL